MDTSWHTIPNILTSNIKFSDVKLHFKTYLELLPRFRSGTVIVRQFDDSYEKWNFHNRSYKSRLFAYRHNSFIHILFGR